MSPAALVTPSRLALSSRSLDAPPAIPAPGGPASRDGGHTSTWPVSGPQIRVRTGRDLAGQRRRRTHRCWDYVIVAPLWPLHGANLGTLLRTCDAVGACMAVPRLPWVPEALARGNTLRRPGCVHWTSRDACQWLHDQRPAGYRVIGVELADEAVRLADLPAARQRTIAVLGHEQTGIPPRPWTCSTRWWRSLWSASAPA